MAKVSQKQKEKIVTKIYYTRCNGIQVPIMSLSKIMKIGLDGLDAGLSETEIGDRIFEFVQTIRAN